MRRRIQKRIKNVGNILFPNVINNTEPNGNQNILYPSIDNNLSINPENNFKIINLEKNFTTDNSDLNTTSLCFESIIPFQSNSNSKELTLSELLATWAVKERINHTALRSLLKVLQTHSCHSDLPNDPRTLLNTPRSMQIKEINYGHYWHYGLKKGIVNILNNLEQYQNNIIELMIGIDGLPISKSSGSQLWPILGKILDLNKVFIIGIYHGHSKKPEYASEFLEDFVNEAKQLVENGLENNGKIYQCCIKIICSDAPAKSFILGVKGHMGYSSCTKCWDVGKFIKTRICFSDIPSRKRTDEEFILKSDEEYHLRTSILEQIPQLGLVTNIPLDYLHLVLLGNMKKLIILWCCDDLKVRLPFSKIKKVSDFIEKIIRPYCPYEFQRKPRGIWHYRQWKGTEFRQLLLYIGPAVFKNILYPEVYNNFLSLHFAISILISKKLCSQESHLVYSQELLQHFVSTFKVIYGEHHVSHNIHGLLHIVEDVRNFGCLDTFSTFAFENYMQKLKPLIKKYDKPLQQIGRRLQEIETNCGTDLHNNFNKKAPYVLSNVHTNGPLLEGCVEPQYSIFKLNGMKLVVQSKANNCCGLGSGEIILMENICYNTKYKDHVVIGKKFLDKRPLYTLPCSSTHIGIYEVSKLSQKAMWLLKCVNVKYFCIPMPGNHNSFAVFPLLHVDQDERPQL